MEGLYVHFGEPVPQLLACETAEACLTHVGDSSLHTQQLCQEWLNQKIVHMDLENEQLVERALKSGANMCSNSTTGFMCSKCDDGYSKVGGRCFDCPGFDWGTLTISLLTSLATALFLLHKSTVSTISKSEIELIWHKVDIYHTDSLNQANVGKVLALLGMNPSKDKLTAMMIKDFYAQKPETSELEKPLDEDEDKDELIVDKKTFVSHLHPTALQCCPSSSEALLPASQL